MPTDVYVNALTTISNEPTSTDSLVCVNRNTNEGQIIDYELLASKVLDKLTSKQFSTLTTTSKLIPGAINELDSDLGSIVLGLPIKLETSTSTVTSLTLFNSEVPGIIVATTERINDKPSGKYGVILIFNANTNRRGGIMICTDGTVYTTAYNASTSTLTGWTQLT